MTDDTPKHLLSVNVSRDENSAVIRAECKCGDWSAASRITEPSPHEVGDVVSNLTRDHRAHVWGSGGEG